MIYGKKLVVFLLVLIASALLPSHTDAQSKEALNTQTKPQSLCETGISYKDSGAAMADANLEVQKSDESARQGPGTFKDTVGDSLTGVTENAKTGDSDLSDSTQRFAYNSNGDTYTRQNPKQSREESTNQQADAERIRAGYLYKLASKENQSLRWDGCLATQAFMRAKQLAAQNYFGHNDPKTGTNPVWNQVKLCVPTNFAQLHVLVGENLAKGVDTPENIHKAFMESASHRNTIYNQRFNRMGVGCSANICVELFAGY
jgi:uncharacterized protein YkwD